MPNSRAVFQSLMTLSFVNTSPMESARVTLAAETLSALVCCMRQRPGMDIVIPGVLDLQKRLRTTLTTDHIFRILDLGMTIEEVLVRVRGSPLPVAPLSPTAKDSTQTNDPDDSLEKEKLLWYVLPCCSIVNQKMDSHTSSLCLALLQGSLH